MNTRRFTLAAVGLLFSVLTTLADGLQVVTSPVDGCFAIAGQTVSDKAIILYDDQDAEVVLTVVDCLMSDLKAVTKKTFLKYRTQPSTPKNAIYTLGMRGVHDTGINGYNSTAERVEALTDIIAYQRQLLADSIGDPTTIPQIFIPYKEVLDCYNAGPQVPEDVTLMWVDDNHGYIRQMPTPTEQARTGGNAIYYHLSYWGSPDSYL